MSAWRRRRRPRARARAPGAKSRTLFVAAALSVSGCGGVGAFDGWFEDDGYVTEVPSRLVVKTLWSRSVGAGSGDEYAALSPLVEERRIYVSDGEGRVTALAAADGELLWRTDLGVSIGAGVGGGDGVLLVATGAGEVVALAADSGAEVWRRDVGEDVAAISAVHRGRVAVRTADGGVFVLAAEDGEKHWSFQERLPSLTLKGMSAPVFYQQLMFVGFDSGRLLVFDLESGNVVQRMKLGIGAGASDLDRIVDIDGRMVVRGGFFYAVAYQGRMIAVDVKRGKLLWSVPLSSHSGLEVDDDNVYVVTVDNRVAAYDRYSGRELWVNERLSRANLGAPLRLGPLVVVGTGRGDLYWLSRNSGALLEFTDVASSPLAPPRVAGRREVAVLDRDGDLTVVTVAGPRGRKR